MDSPTLDASRLSDAIDDGDADEARAAINDIVVARTVERMFELDDISIRSGGDGRTVVAYAAMFGVEAEINDQDGHYIETIARTAFDRTIAARAGKISVFYNHAKTMYGTPSERFSMPLGLPLEITPDAKGVLTVTRYNNNPLADEVLESIRNGDITGQSFSGKAIRSQRTRNRSGGLDAIVRNEMSLLEYGPTPMPAYKEAAIMGVRSEELAIALRSLSVDERTHLFEILGSTPAPSEEPAAGTSEDVTQTLDANTSTEPAAGTSEETPTPDPVHVGPTPTERRQRAWSMKEQTS